MAAKRIYINGRFLGAHVTGVQRFGLEIVKAFDRLIETEGGGKNSTELTLLCPQSVREIPTFARIQVRRVGRLSGHLWEQIELPWHCRDGVLISLCNTGPLVRRNQIVVIHDAAVFAMGEAYTWAFRVWYRVLLSRLATVAHRVVTVSEFSRLELARHLGISSASMDLVSEGGEHLLRVRPDYSILERFQLQKRAFVLGVSSLAPHKNFRAVVSAMELLSDLDCEFVVAGGANPRIFSSNPDGLSARVKHLGYVTDEELRALYEHAVCLVYPSLYEGFGLPPLEAMVCGCPVIVSREASLPEVCGDAALYCNPYDPKDIARCVERLLTDTALQRTLRAKGVERSRQFTWMKGAGLLAERAMNAASWKIRPTLH